MTRHLVDRLTRYTLLVVLGLVSIQAYGQQAPPEFSQEAAVIHRILHDNIIPFWYPRVMDHEAGGYRLNHDIEGSWGGPSDKGIVVQSRTVWYFARLANAGIEREQNIEAALHGYRFLKDAMWDREYGGFYWAVNHAGTEPTVSVKDLYGISFGLYALSELYLATHRQDVLDLANELFALLEWRAYDRQYGGYREYFERDWSAASGPVTTMGRPGPDIKLMNTHLHLLESMTTYYLASRNPVARERLLELIRIEANTVVRKQTGACTDKYTRDWMPLHGPEYDIASYGHDIENIWLLVEACKAAGIAVQPYVDLFRTLMEYALQHGYDRRQGGFWYSGPLGQSPTERNKSWWVQAECLVGALYMYRLTGESQYRECFSGMLKWIKEHQVDWQHGDWFAGVDATGKPSGQKAFLWKSPYHNGRAMLQCLDVLREMTVKP